MGLDLTFNLTAAKAAGMQFRVEPRSTPEAIAHAVFNGDDEDYINYLREDMTIMSFTWAGIRMEREVGLYEDNVFVRANRWGDLYRPLTLWLDLHGISWGEF